jgi:hypothetical protein
LLFAERVEALDLDQARREVEPFVDNPETLALWSKDFFKDLATRIQLV